MCLLEFGDGNGVVGRSVLHKLREFRKLHEMAWGDEVLRDKNGVIRPLQGKNSRRVALNDQRANTVADIAAVLAGRGRANLINKGPGPGHTLWHITIRWENEFDKQFAKEWPSNVTHKMGIPDVYAESVSALQKEQARKSA